MTNVPILPIGTVMVINDKGLFRHQGYSNGRKMKGYISDYHGEYRNVVTPGNLIDESKFIYIIQWPNGHSNGYRSMDVSFLKEPTNEDMLHVLRKNK